MNKKGAIEITATAIVVFIIAIVVLGAVIYFIQSFFPNVFNIVETQLETIKQTLRTQLKSGEKVAFDFGSELKIKSGDKKDIYMGVKNDYPNPSGDSVCFRVALTCVKAFNTDRPECKNTLVGGVDLTGNKATTKWFGAENLLESWSIKNNEFDAQGPLSLQPTVPSDIYSIRADVYKDQANADCTSPSFASIPYYSKQFRLIVQ